MHSEKCENYNTSNHWTQRSDEKIKGGIQKNASHTERIVWMNFHCTIWKSNRKSSWLTDYEKTTEFLNDTGLIQKEIKCPKLARRRKSKRPNN